MSDYACNMWRLVKGEEDVFPHKNYYTLDPYTIYLETDEEDKNTITTIYFPLSHLELDNSAGKFLGFKIGEEHTFIANKNLLEDLISKERLLEFPHYTGGSCETAAIYDFSKKKIQTFIDLFSNCIETLEGMLK